MAVKKQLFLDEETKMAAQLTACKYRVRSGAGPLFLQEHLHQVLDDCEEGHLQAFRLLTYTVWFNLC